LKNLGCKLLYFLILISAHLGKSTRTNPSNFDLNLDDISGFLKTEIFSMYLHCPDIWIFGMVSPAAEGSARPQYIDFKGNGLRAGYWQGIPT